MDDAIARLKKIQEDQQQKNAEATPPAKAPPSPAKVVHLPVWPDATRAQPNTIARSALFSVKSRGRKREYLKNAVIYAYGDDSIAYTGEQLRQDDQDVYLQLIHLARRIPLGQAVEFSSYAMLQALNWPTSGQNHYERLKACITRLKANQVAIGGKVGYAGSLIHDYAWKEPDGSTSRAWRIWLNPKIVALFAHNTYTQIEWEQRLLLGPLAKWLHSFYATHVQPYPLKVATLHQLCGSDAKQLSGFRRSLKLTLDELKDVGFLASWEIDDNDLVLVKRAKQLPSP